jgi:hypothetical protein
MPKRILQIKDFSGGINTLKDPADIADNELANIENLSVKTQGSITPAYLNTDASNNKISGYNNNTIVAINAGYGLGYFETDHVRDAVEVEYDNSTLDVNNGFDLLQIDGTARTNAGNDRRFNLKTSGTDTNLTTSFPIGSRILLTGVSTHTLSFASGRLSASAQGVYTVVDHDSNDIIVDRQLYRLMHEKCHRLLLM